MSENWQFLLKLNTRLPYDTTILLLDIYPRKMKTYIYKKIFYIKIFTAASVSQ